MLQKNAFQWCVECLHWPWGIIQAPSHYNLARRRLFMSLKIFEGAFLDMNVTTCGSLVFYMAANCLSACLIYIPEYPRYQVARLVWLPSMVQYLVS